MKLRYTIGLIGLALAGAVIGGCSANGSMANSNPAVAQLPFAGTGTQVAYKQIELLSRPAVKEAFEMFEDHNKTNRSEPYNDPVLQGEIESFAAMFRDQTTAQTLQAVLYPNVMKVDLSQNTHHRLLSRLRDGRCDRQQVRRPCPQRRHHRHLARRDLRQYAVGAGPDPRRS